MIFMNRLILFVFLFFFTSMMIFSSGGKEKEVPVVVQVTGVVRLTGSALFPELVISGAEHAWYAAKEEAGKLYDLQHCTVTVEAEETVKELFFANGRSAGLRRELRNIKIITVE